jgi:tetratricopeptide (TPR) repeat protein
VPHIALCTFALLAGAPDSLPQRLARLDYAINRGKADSVWQAASPQAARSPTDRLAALEAGAAALALSRPADAEALLRRSLSNPDSLQDRTDLEAATWLGALFIRAGNAAEAQRWLNRSVVSSSRLGDIRTHAEAVALLAELDLRSGRGANAIARLETPGLVPPNADPLTRARIACSRGRILGVLGRHGAADSSARAGVAQARAAGLHVLAGGCQASLGIAQAQRATFFAADTSLAEAVTLLETGGSPRTLAAALQWRGYVLRELARLGEADSVLRLAVAQADSIGDRGVRGWSRLNLGLLASSFGDLEQASSDLDQAVAAFDTIQDRWGRHTALLSRAHALRQLGDLDAAERAATEVLAWARAASAAHTGLLAHQQLAWIAEARGHIAAARRHLGEAGRLSRASGLVDAQLGLAYQQARLDVATGTPARAIPVLERYLAAVGDVPQRRYAARTRLAEALAALGDTPGAARELTLAMDDLDAWRKALGNDALRRAVFGATIDDPDPDLGVASIIARIASSGDDATAFALAERRRARELGDQLLRIDAARQAGTSDPRSARPAVRSLAEVRGALPDSRATLVTFVVGRGGEPTTAFVLTRDILRSVTMAPADSLGAVVNRALVIIGTEPSLPPVLLQTLTQSLVTPWLALVPADVTTLVLVPEDHLHHVPFDLLLSTGAGRPTPALAYAPSASILAELGRTRQAPAGPILAFADPPLPAGEALTGPDGWRGPIAPLPGARREVGHLKRHVAGVRARTGRDARASILRQPESADARVLHFATHAQVDERSPLRTFVWLAPGDGSDGRVTAAEIEALTLKAELVVLSACRTATGRLQVGEGVQGLTAPFLSAGARSVVASRWDVDDQATALMMEDFYRALLERQPVAAALTTARDAARARGAPATVWGAFVVVGDPWAKPGLERAPRGVTPLLIVLGLGGAGLFWWVRRRLRRQV